MEKIAKLIIVSGPVIVENNRVLLAKHGEDDFWKFCGGRAEAGEFNLKDIAIREVKEEMGLDIEISNHQPYFFYVEKMLNNQLVSIVLVHFLATRLSEVMPGPDIREWRWLDLGGLSQENLAPNIQPALQYFGFIK